MPDNRQILGQSGEELAVTELRRQGYRIVARNFRCRLGEIDIIATEGDSLVFVEVKTRQSESCGSPAEAVTSRKQRQISKVAQFYLLQQNFDDLPARFDVVIVVTSSNGLPRIELIKNAFDLCE